MKFLIQRCWICKNKTFCSKPLCASCQIEFWKYIRVRNHSFNRKGITAEIVTFLDYSNPFVRKIILTIKESKKATHVRYFVNQIYKQWILLERTQKPFELILPIPSSTQRHHGQLIAQSLAETTNSVWIDCLEVAEVDQQKHLNQKERKNRRFNAHLSFRDEEDLFVVDDLLVTGGSFFAAAEALGLKRISGFALAFQPKQLES